MTTDAKAPPRPSQPPTKAKGPATGRNRAARRAPTPIVPTLDVSDAPICVPLQPGDIRDLYLLIKQFPMQIPGLPTDAQFEALSRLRRIRMAFDAALAKAGQPPLDPPAANGAEAPA